MAALTPACVWRIRPEVVVLLDERFGEPADAYVDGSQVWLRDDGPDQLTVEWRLHPVPGFRRPREIGTYDLFTRTALALGSDGVPPAPPARLWEGLEAFPAYGDEVEPAILAAACGAALGVAPDAAGLVDHEPIGAEWARRGGRSSIIGALLEQLGAG